MPIGQGSAALIPLPALQESALEAVSYSNPYIYGASKAIQFVEGARSAYNLGKKMVRAGKGVHSSYKKNLVGRKRARTGPKKSKKSRMYPNFTSDVKVARGGYGKSVSVAKKSRRKKKKSIKKRIAALEKKNGSLSKYQTTSFEPYTLSSAGCNTATSSFLLNNQQKAIFEIENYFHNHTRIETELNRAKTDNLTSIASNDTTANGSFYIKRFTTIKLKNSGLSAVNLRYVNFECKDNTGQNVIEQMNGFLNDRGLSEFNYQTPVAADNIGPPVHSNIPAFQWSPIGKSRLNVLSTVSDVQSYKQVGTISKVTLRPGDEVTLYASKFHKYSAEKRDRDPNTYMKDLWFGHLIEVEGEIMHDDTDVMKVGHADFHIDAYVKSVISFNFDNGFGSDTRAVIGSNMHSSSNGWTTAGPNVAILGDGA